MADGAAPSGLKALDVKSVPRRKVAVWAGLAVLTLAALALGHWLLIGQFEQKTDNAFVRADISMIAARVEGYVAAVKVNDNQAVKAGDVLLELDDADYRARLARAEADLARAKAELIGRQAGMRSAGAQIGQQGERIAQARATLAAANADQARLAAERKRYTALHARGLVAQSRLDQIDAEAARAAAEARGARANLAWQGDQSGVLSSERARTGADALAAKAAVNAAEAALAAARLDIDRTKIRAPIDGVVGDRIVQQGQLVRPGVQLMAVVPLADVFVVANFKETQLAKMRPGQKVDVAVEAFPHLKLTGVVDSLSPASGAQFSIIPQDTATGNFTKIVQRVPVKIRLNMTDEARGLLRPGLSVKAKVETR